VSYDYNKYKLQFNVLLDCAIISLVDITVLVYVFSLSILTSYNSMKLYLYVFSLSISHNSVLIIHVLQLNEVGQLIFSSFYGSATEVFDTISISNSSHTNGSAEPKINKINNTIIIDRKYENHNNTTCSQDVIFLIQ